MSKKEKLIASILARPKEVEFRDVRRLLESHGWYLYQHGGSHASFRLPGRLPVIVPTVSGRKVRGNYLKGVLDAIGIEAKCDER